MEEYANGQMNISITEDIENITITWTGHSRSLNSEIELNPYLKNLARELPAKKIIIDFTQFKSMNSSTIMPILFFIQSLEEKAFTTQIFYNGKAGWQKASFVVVEEIIKNYKYVKIFAK